MCENFSHEICKLVVVQICQSLNFHSIYSSVCETLADILQKYIEEISYNAHFYAQVACRTEVNLNDVRLALQRLHVKLSDLINYLANAPEIPLSKPVPDYPVQKKSSRIVELRGSPEETLPPHIPSFLPPFPDPHTYVKTPIYTERVTDITQIRKLRTSRKRKNEASLARLSQAIKDNTNITITNYLTHSSSQPTGPPKSLASDFGVNNLLNPFLIPPKIRRSTNDPSSTTTEKSSSEAESTKTPTIATQAVVHPTARYVKYVEGRDGIDVSDIPSSDTRSSTISSSFSSLKGLTEEDSERAKKIHKCQRILDLSHSGGIEQLTDTYDDENSNFSTPNPASPP